MQQKSTQRIIYYDLLRVLAIFIVVFRHVCSIEFDKPPLSIDWCIANMYNSLFPRAVPIFLMISGALLLIPNKKVTYRDILTIRIPRLLIAYLFWTIVYYFVFWYQGRFSIRGLLLSHFHLWFLPMLMGVYLLIPFLRSIVKDKKMMYYALFIWIGFVLISFFRFLTIIKMMKHFDSLFDMNIVVGYSGYLLLGYFLSQYVFSKKYRIGVYLLGIGSALVTLIGFYFFYDSKCEFFSNFSIQAIAMSSALFILMKELAPKCGTIVLRFIDFVRKDLFGVYLTHALWLPVINTETIRHCCSEIITLPMIAIVVFLLSLFTTKIIRLIPFLRKVVE